MKVLDRFVAVDNVCAWPNEPDTNRMNVAAGLGHDGTLIVLASGWGQKEGTFRDRIVPCWACLSQDGGRSWERTDTVEPPAGRDYVIPFGDVVCLPDGVLAVSCYALDAVQKVSNSYLLLSRDGGRSWGEAMPIGTGDHNETALLRLREGRMLAACRTQADGHLDLFLSEDEGATWQYKGMVALAGQIPSHLCRLADGRVLLVFGIRNEGLHGVGARLSSDEGETWGRPLLLAEFGGAPDCGYPASVQLEDGTIVTAYYANHAPYHDRYHMGVVRWQTED